MSTDFVTIAAFPTPAEAEIARNRLVEEGIPAFLAGEETAGTLWHLTPITGGVKLQVERVHADRAKAVLEKSVLKYRAMMAGLDDEEPEETPTHRERNAQRALTAAIVGLMVWPVLLYALWLLGEVAAAEERLRPEHKRKAVIAAAIALPAAVLLGLGLFTLCSGPFV